MQEKTLLLAITVPPAIEAAVIDSLLAHPELADGFASTRIAVHGPALPLCHSSEQVSGHVERQRFELHCRDREQAEQMLALLRQQFPAARLTYWLAPLLACGGWS